MNTLIYFFLLIFTIPCVGSLLTDYIIEVDVEQPTLQNGSFKTFGIEFSTNADFSFIASDLLKYDLEIQIIDQVNHTKLPKNLKIHYSSRNTPPYLIAQILSHLHAYKHCIVNNIPFALMLEKDAFIYSDPSCLYTHMEELEKTDPNWDILFTDVHYHLPKDGSLAAPQLNINGRILPTHAKLSENISRVNCRYGTVSFLISLSGMKKILNFYSNYWLDLPYDQALFKIPNLKIFSVNQDIITNVHRCKKYDRWLASRISNSTKFSDELSFTSSYPIGKNIIHSEDLLIPHNWELIKPYVRKKFEYIIETNNWIRDLDNVLSPDLSDQTIVINPMGHIISGNETAAQALFSQDTVEVLVSDKQNKKDPQFSLNNCEKLSSEQKDFLAYQYLQLFPHHFIVCLFPRAEGLDDLTERILQKHGVIIYKKMLTLNKLGSLEFIKLIYHGEGWVGNEENNYKLGHVKANQCFPPRLLDTSPLRVYLYYCPSLDEVKMVKASIRELYQCSNDSIHINDYPHQAKMVGAAVFNNESIYFLNHRQSNKTPNFNWLLPHFKLLVAEKNLPIDHYCVDTSGVLSVYGLRDCQDLDILHDPNYPLPPKDNIDSHNAYLKYHQLSLDEMLWNPNNHFYYNGVKFLSLDLVKNMKENRGNSKDKNDVQLINSLRP